jgi:hypothetical protein
MDKKQTAVEWLVDQLEKHYVFQDIKNTTAFLQAKEMEKEKQKYFFDCGRQYQLTGEGTFNEVYNETYGGNK